jgi:mono/diheme cytochrome c family protein
MTINRIKLFAIILFALPLLALTMFKGSPINVQAAVVDDPAATFKAKCAMCHSANAAKFFDPAKTEDELVQTVLKGKKGEKPPFMPGFEAKGMAAEEAKGLVTYMKSLRATAN